MHLLKQTANLEDFLPHILAATVGSEDGPSLPKEAAISYLREAAITFCEKTGIIKRDIYIDLQCGLSEYLLETLDCDETILRISEAHLGNFSSEPDCLCWSWGNVGFEFDDDMLKVSPPPSEDIQNGLHVKAVVAPAPDACKVDYQLYSKWRSIIVDGALAEVHLMSNQPWSSIGRSDLRRRQFNEAIERVKIGKLTKGMEDRPHRLGPNPMWRSRKSWRRF